MNTKLPMPSTDGALPNPARSTLLKRRNFLQALGGTAATVGLVACADDGPTNTLGADGMLMTDMASTGGATAVPIDERADAIVPTLTPVAELQPAPDDEVNMSYAPEVPPGPNRSDQRIVEFSIDVTEGTAEIDPDNGVSTMVWGFRIGGDTAVTTGAPGPVMRARVGDLCRITVNNLAENENPHNIDWHAITGQGGGAEATTLAPGESATINARLLYPGAFMYHCAYGDVPEHIAHGMYGMMIVDPETPLPTVDHEWAIMQSEWYTAEPDAAGMAAMDRERLTFEHPSYVTFNGKTGSLTGDNALQMDVGQRARIYFVNEGLNLDSNFHLIGSHWDVVYPEAATHPYNRVIRGSQSTLVVAGGGTVVEAVAYVPMTAVLVDHALVRTFYKGCVGQIVMNGEPNAIFAGSDEELAGAAEPDTAGPPADPNTVIIPAGAFDPANADTAYLPQELTVVAGTTVTWINNDSVFHTVTSGASNGTVGEPDDLFDSGEIQSGQQWQHTFDDEGEFDYYCAPHPWMVGRVVVTGE